MTVREQQLVMEPAMDFAASAIPNLIGIPHMQYVLGFWVQDVASPSALDASWLPLRAED